MSPEQLNEYKSRAAQLMRSPNPSVLALQEIFPALFEEIDWRIQHMAETDKELCQLQDWLIGNAIVDPKTGLIDRTAKLKERIRDLVSAEAELTELRKEQEDLGRERDLLT